MFRYFLSTTAMCCFVAFIISSYEKNIQDMIYFSFFSLTYTGWVIIEYLKELLKEIKKP